MRLERGGGAVAIVAGDLALRVHGPRLKDHASTAITHSHVQPHATGRIAGRQFVPRPVLRGNVDTERGARQLGAIELTIIDERQSAPIDTFSPVAVRMPL